MSMAKVAITVESRLLHLIDQWVAQRRFASRSQVIQVALREQVAHWQHTRLAAEVRKLDPKAEQALAEERFPGEAWPAY